MVNAAQEQRFSELFTSFSGEIFQYVYYRTRDGDLSNDLVQTIFTRVLSRIDSIEPHTERAYIMTMTKNALIDHYRTHKVTTSFDDAIPSHDPLDSNTNPEHKIITDQDQQFVFQALESMNPQDSEIIRLRALLDWSYPEIAQHLGESEQTIRKRYSRALARFAEIIQETYH